jgi:hypothetical protein
VFQARVRFVGFTRPSTPHHYVTVGCQVGGVGKGRGIAALKEWPENFFATPPTWRSNKDTTVDEKIFWVRFFPFANRNTGRLVSDKLVLRFASDFKAEKGQKLLFFISKRSTKLPELPRMTLGNLMFITTELFFVNFIWFQVSVFGSCSFDLGSISPMRKEPKNATQHAVQNTDLLSWDQLLVAISWPSSFKSGNDITNLERLEMEEYSEMFLAPFNIALMK